MTTTRTPVSLCPSCGKTLDAMTPAGNEDFRPGPGDVTVCLGCAAVLIVNHDLTVRPPTPVELNDLEKDKELLRLRETIQYLNARQDARQSNPRVRSRRSRR